MWAPFKDRRAQTEQQWRAQSDALRCLQGNNPARRTRSSMPTQLWNGERWAEFCVPFHQCNVLHSPLQLLSLTPLIPPSASHLSLSLPHLLLCDSESHCPLSAVRGRFSSFPHTMCPLPASFMAKYLFTSPITLLFNVSCPLSHLNLCRTLIPPLLAPFLSIYLTIYPSIYVSVCLSICLPVHLFICLSLSVYLVRCAVGAVSWRLFVFNLMYGSL